MHEPKVADGQAHENGEPWMGRLAQRRPAGGPLAALISRVNGRPLPGPSWWWDSPCRGLRNLACSPAAPSGRAWPKGWKRAGPSGGTQRRPGQGMHSWSPRAIVVCVAGGGRNGGGGLRPVVGGSRPCSAYLRRVFTGQVQSDDRGRGTGRVSRSDRLRRLRCPLARRGWQAQKAQAHAGSTPPLLRRWKEAGYTGFR
jgi:hypothetical protein